MQKNNLKILKSTDKEVEKEDTDKVRYFRLEREGVCYFVQSIEVPREVHERFVKKECEPDYMEIIVGKFVDTATEEYR